MLANLWRLPPRPEPAAASGESGAAPAATALIVGGLLWLSGGAAITRAAEPAMLPDSVTQTIRVEDTFALATAKIHWQAVRGQVLPLLAEPAVLTHVTYPGRSARDTRNNWSRGPMARST